MFSGVDREKKNKRQSGASRQEAPLCLLLCILPAVFIRFGRLYIFVLRGKERGILFIDFSKGADKAFEKAAAVFIDIRLFGQGIVCDLGEAVIAVDLPAL